MDEHFHGRIMYGQETQKSERTLISEIQDERNINYIIVTIINISSHSSRNGFMTTEALGRTHAQLHVAGIQKTKERSSYHIYLVILQTLILDL